MSKAMGFNYLPLEVLEVIVTYLSVRDLANCIGVNRTWYNIFSNDLFWKKHCMPNLSDYFSKTKCLVEPTFKPPSSEILQIQEKRLQFLQEQHLWRNWDSKSFVVKEIEFDCDDSISYNIKATFLGNDHVCLHRTFQTEVWNVVDTPFSVMTIPHHLNELWEVNVYSVLKNLLVVIQCNVVQIFQINLDTKSWCLNNIFFYNKPEEFSSSITPETDVDALFQQENTYDETIYERIVCGQYLVGVCMNEESPLLHVWNLNTGKKLKEDKCEIFNGSYSLGLKAPNDVYANKVLVTYKSKNNASRSDEKSCSIVYDLVNLHFVMSTRQDHFGEVMYFDGCLSVVDDDPYKILRHNYRSVKNESKLDTTCLPDFISLATSIQPLGGNLLISTREELLVIDTSEVVIQSPEKLILVKVDFDLSHVVVLFNRYVLLHEVDYSSIKELRKLDKSLTKVAEFPPDTGTFVASNNACSRIALERGNKLIIMNFW